MSETPIPSNPVFRVSGGMKVVLSAVIIPLALLVAGGTVWLVFFAHLRISDTALLATFGGIFAAGIGYLSITTLRTSIEVLPTGFRFTSGFAPAEEVSFDRIAGYRALKRKGTQSLIIVCADPGHKPIMIGQNLERHGELEDFVSERFDNLDVVEKTTDMAKALSDDSLGSTTEERSAAISQAQFHAVGINAAAIATLFWAILYPHPYAFLMGVLAVIPLLAVASAVASHGAISLFIVKNSVRPGVTLAFLMPAAALALRAIKDWHLMGLSGFWLPFAVLSCLLVAILWVGSISDSHRTLGRVLGLSIVMLVESYGLVVFANCYFDHSVPDIHTTKVVSRKITRGKSTSYYVIVGPWLDGRHNRQILVNSSFYESHSEGSTVLIGVRPGVLRIPWFSVD
jgi:hypothetical protein